MLLLENVQKTFNKGTVNEKKALTGVNLNMNSRDFVTVIGGKRRGQVHDAEYGCRRLPHRQR